MDNSNSRITVVMPAYNAEEYVWSAVDSILNQTLKEFQLWIIDDGSTDNTRALIEKINDPRVSKIYHDVNRGRVAVVNEVIHHIQTEYFTITDADDISHPTRLEKQVQWLDNNSSLMMCGTSYAAMNEAGYIIRSMNLPTDYQTIYTNIVTRSQFHGPTTVMRRQVIDTFPEFYRNYFKDNMADSDLAARIVDKFQAINLSEKLYFYRIVKTSLSRKNYSIRFANLHSLIGVLSKQRREHGTDDLMDGNSGKANQYIAAISKRYEKNPSLLYQQAATYHLYWKMNQEAWRNILKAISLNPYHFRNFFLLVFILVMICRNSILKITRSHYSVHILKNL